jgi:hypothetical protein
MSRGDFAPEQQQQHHHTPSSSKRHHHHGSDRDRHSRSAAGSSRHYDKSPLKRLADARGGDATDAAQRHRDELHQRMLDDRFWAGLELGTAASAAPTTPRSSRSAAVAAASSSSRRVDEDDERKRQKRSAKAQELVREHTNGNAAAARFAML